MYFRNYFFVIIFAALIFNHAFAAMVDITLNDGRVFKQCNSDDLYEKIYCKDNDLLVLAGSFTGPSGVENSKGKIKPVIISSIRSKGKTLFEASKVIKKPTKDAEKWVDDGLSRYRAIKRLISRANESEQGDYSEFDLAKKRVSKKIDLEISSIMDAHFPKKVTMELITGEKYKCKKRDTVNKHAGVLAKEKDLKIKIECGLYFCGKNKNGEDVSLVIDPNEVTRFSDVLVTGKDGFVNGYKVKSVYTKKLFGKKTMLSKGFTYKIPANSEFSMSSFVTKEMEPNKDYFFKSQNSGYELRSKLNKCGREDKKHILNAQELYKMSLKKSTLVQYISLFDGSVGSVFMAPNSCPDYAYEEGGVYYNPKAYDYALRNLPTKDPHAITNDKAMELFEYAKSMDDIAWNYKRDGCYARAHLMARRFEDKGIYVEKAWVKGNLRFDPPKGSSTEWNFHVAPIVYIDDGDGKVEKYVIDPSVSSAPIKVKGWLKLMNVGNKGDVQGSNFPFPSNPDMYRRAALAFSNSDPYLPYDNILMTEDEKMNRANVTMTDYKGQ